MIACGEASIVICCRENSYLSSIIGKGSAFFFFLGSLKVIFLFLAFGDGVEIGSLGLENSFSIFGSIGCYLAIS
jgi:hypothetical protein